MQALLNAENNKFKKDSHQRLLKGIFGILGCFLRSYYCLVGMGVGVGVGVGVGANPPPHTAFRLHRKPAHTPVLLGSA